MNIQKSHDAFLTNLYTNIGCTLMLCQLVESQLKNVNGMEIKDNEEVKFETLFSSKPDKKMIGILIERLRRKFKLPKDFEEHLNDFCKKRNKLVHRLSDELYSPPTNMKVLVKTHLFVSELREVSKQLIDTLCSVTISVASNHKSPLKKNKVESLFHINKVENNYFIEQMKKIIQE